MSQRYRIRTVHGGTLLVLILLLLSGCRGSRPDAAAEAVRPVSLVVTGAPDLNSAGSEGGAAQSARVRIYELTGETNFRTVTLETFWRDDAAALGEELVGSRQILLYPNTSEAVELEPAAATRFIGVAANLRAPDPRQWRQVLPVEALQGRQVRVDVGADRVTVDVQ